VTYAMLWLILLHVLRAGVQQGWDIVQEEVFGPVVTVQVGGSLSQLVTPIFQSLSQSVILIFQLLFQSVTLIFQSLSQSVILIFQSLSQTCLYSVALSVALSVAWSVVLIVSLFSHSVSRRAFSVYPILSCPL
jgi:hypothetical protein